MGQVIDTSVWIDFLRDRTPESIRQIADKVINAEDALLCEPIRFELLRGASNRERKSLLQLLETLPVLPTPTHLWDQGCSLATQSVDQGLRVSSLDILIAALCLHHEVGITTFDAHFVSMQAFAPLQVNLLERPD